MGFQIALCVLGGSAGFLGICWAWEQGRPRAWAPPWLYPGIGTRHLSRSRRGYLRGTGSEGCTEGMLAAERRSKPLPNRASSGCQQHGAASAGDRYLISGRARAVVTASCATHTNCLCVGEIRCRHCATPAPHRPLAGPLNPHRHGTSAPPAHRAAGARPEGAGDGAGVGPLQQHVGCGRVAGHPLAHTPGPLSVKRSAPKPSAPPCRAFCYFYQ